MATATKKKAARKKKTGMLGHATRAANRAIGEVDGLASMLHGPVQPLCPELQEYTYEEESIGTCIKHPLYFSILHCPQMNALANKSLSLKKEYLARQEADGDFGACISLHEKPYRFEALARYEDRLKPREFWALFADVYVGCENWYQEPNATLIADWLQGFYHARKATRRQIRKWVMSAEEQKEYSNLQERLRVFRGWSRDGGERGYSWSLDIDKAEWFSGRLAEHDNPEAYQFVAWGWVEKEDALGYFTSRNESEIFCPHEYVQVSSVDIVNHSKAKPIPVDSMADIHKPIVSFDFDGTLHSDVDAGGNPRNFWRDNLTPREEIISLMRRDAEKNKIVIVTRRDYSQLGAVCRFCIKHRLPVATIYPTYDMPKEPYLETIKAIRHYDDQPIRSPVACVV